MFFDFSKDLSKLPKAWVTWIIQTCKRIEHLLMEIHQGHWKVKAIHLEHVKSYAPHVDHVVLDLDCKPMTE